MSCRLLTLTCITSTLSCVALLPPSCSGSASLTTSTLCSCSALLACSPVSSTARILSSIARARAARCPLRSTLPSKRPAPLPPDRSQAPPPSSSPCFTSNAPISPPGRLRYPAVLLGKPLPLAPPLPLLPPCRKPVATPPPLRASTPSNPPTAPVPATSSVAALKLPATSSTRSPWRSSFDRGCRPLANLYRTRLCDWLRGAPGQGAANPTAQATAYAPHRMHQVIPPFPPEGAPPRPTLLLPPTPLLRWPTAPRRHHHIFHRPISPPSQLPFYTECTSTSAPPSQGRVPQAGPAA